MVKRAISTKGTRHKTMVLLALAIPLLAAGLSSCQSPLFGLGGQVDTAVPGLSVSSIEEGGLARALVNGDYVRGQITLAGTAKDDLGVASVRLSFSDNGTDIVLDANVDATAQRWSCGIDTAQYLDGAKDFTVTVTDTSSKTNQTRFVLYFDNRPPTVLLTIPASDEGSQSTPLYGVIDIKGSAADQFGIRKVRVYVYGPSNNLLYESPDDASIGTNSFALRLDTGALIGKSGMEVGYIYVKAWDRSGNSNEQFYRLDELKALNGNKGATVEELHALEIGTSSTANGISLTDAASARRYRPGTGYDASRLLAYHFDQSSNLPVITVSNPEQGKTAEQNVLARTARASGIVEDANGVASVKIQFRLLNGSETQWFADADTTTSGGDIDVSGTGRVVNWNTKPLEASAAYGLSIGVQSIRVEAIDSLGNASVSAWVPFTIDADAPVVEILSPVPGAYCRGDPIRVSGTAESFGTATVAAVDVSIGNTWYAAASSPSSTSVSWSIDLTQAEHLPMDGLRTVKARVTDSVGKIAYSNIVVTIDRTPPHDLSISSPVRGTSVNGLVILRGQAKDNILLDKAWIVFERNGLEDELGDAYNWSFELDVGTMANETYGYSMGNNIYRVPIRLKTRDKAGNVTQSPSFGSDKNSPAPGSYYLDVDLDGDKPTITNILFPGPENTPATPHQIIGSVRLQGTAFDDDRLHSVEMALIALSGSIESWRSLKPTEDYQETSAESFYPITGTTLWSQVLNDKGELYALGDVAGHKGDFRVIVRAVDTKDGVTPDVIGNPKTLYLRFDNTLPGVINLLPEEGKVVRGIVPLRFTAQDNIRVTNAEISYNNGSTYTPLAITQAATVPIAVDFDTRSVNGSAFASSSGTLYMRIRLKDDAGNVTEKSFRYLVDNVPPNSVTPPSPASMAAISNRMYTDSGASLAEIMGVVNDSGAVRGIRKVEVYFERLGSVYRLHPTKLASQLTARDHAFDNGETALYPYTTILDDGDDYKIIIDRAENYNDGAGDKDGYEENLTQGSSGYTWGARFDSSKIPDGTVNVHYVAWDDAGNASHFVVAGVIQNDPPRLTAITLGTDLNGDGDATDAGERVRLTKQADGTWRGYALDALADQLGAERAYDLSQPILTVRNNRFTFAATVSGGNGALAYHALAPNGTNPLLNWIASSSYEVTSFGSDGWTEDSINTLTIQARDSAHGPGLLSELLSFKVRVDNTDNTAPEISLAPIGSRFLGPNSGQSLSYSVRTVQAVASYADNLLWLDANADGLCSWDERLGHVELPGDSLYDGPDADVSGTIKLRGKVYDDQRISRITVAFSVGFDTNGTAADGAVAAGTEIDLATFTGGSLSAVTARQAAMDSASNTLAFELDGKNAPELSDELGHAMNYTLTWNTAFITGVAAKNVVVTIRAYNADGTLSTTATQTVDVVPYITRLERNPANYATTRTANGYYPVQANETGIRIHGFNLQGGIVQVYRTGESATTQTWASDSTGDTILATAGTSSGFLRVAVGTETSVNQSNSNLRDYNQESIASRYAYTRRWTDDRYVWVWSVGHSFNGSNGARYPSMSAGGDGTLYGAWVSYASSSSFFNTVGGATPTRSFYMYDPQEFSDIYVDPSDGTVSIALAANHLGASTWTDPPGVGNAGGLAVYSPNAPSVNWGSNYNSRAYGVEYLNYDQELWQFQRPRLVRWNVGASASDWLHVAYFDSVMNSVKVSSFPDNGAFNPSTTPKGWVVLDGGYDAQDEMTNPTLANSVTNVSRPTTSTAVVPEWAGYMGPMVGRAIQTVRPGWGTTTNTTITGWDSATGTITFAGTPATNQTSINFTMTHGGKGVVSTGVARSSSAGEYVAIDVDEVGRPVVAYYDITNQTLRLARATTATPASAADWRRQDVFRATDPRRMFAGQHVDIKFDSDGNLHVVCIRSSSGDLLYLFAADVDDDSDYVFSESFVIDEEGSVGAGADLSVDSLGNPSVSYLNSTSSGTFDGLKYAKRSIVAPTVSISSSTTRSLTSASLVGSENIRIGDCIRFNDNDIRKIDAFNPSTGTVTWTTARTSAPTGNVTIMAWEHQVVPSSASVMDSKTNLEVWKTALYGATVGWGTAAISYRSTRAELVYLQPE